MCIVVLAEHLSRCLPLFQHLFKSKLEVFSLTLYDYFGQSKPKSLHSLLYLCEIWALISKISSILKICILCQLYLGHRLNTVPIQV